MKYLSFISIILLMSCSKTLKSSETTSKDSIKIKKDSSLAVKTESDCVFSDDYKGLTTEWLTKLSKSDYVWMESLKSAAITINESQDTIYLSKGGCVHFGVSVELHLTNDDHPTSDSAFWVQQALQLATEFDMKHYKNVIEEMKFKKMHQTDSFLTFEIEDNNTDDNKYYNGIMVRFGDKTKVLSLKQYSN